MPKIKIHNKIAGIIIKDKKLLMCKKYDEPHFIMPGGKIKENETNQETLKRELKEELNVNLLSAKEFKTWEAPHFKDPDKIVKMKTFFIEIEGEPQATGEVDEIKWIDTNYKQQGLKVASIDEDYLIPELKEKGLIN